MGQGNEATLAILAHLRRLLGARSQFIVEAGSFFELTQLAGLIAAEGTGSEIHITSGHRLTSPQTKAPIYIMGEVRAGLIWQGGFLREVECGPGHATLCQPSPVTIQTPRSLKTPIVRA